MQLYINLHHLVFKRPSQVRSKSPPQTKPKVCFPNLGKIQNINHRCLSSSYKHVTASWELMHRKPVWFQEAEKVQFWSAYGFRLPLYLSSVLSQTRLLPLHRAAAECDKHNLVKNKICKPLKVHLGAHSTSTFLLTSMKQ